MNDSGIPTIECAMEALSTGNETDKVLAIASMTMHAIDGEESCFEDSMTFQVMMDVCENMSPDLKGVMLFFEAMSECSEGTVMRFVTPRFMEVMRNMVMGGDPVIATGAMRILGNVIERSELLARVVVSDAFVDDIIERCLSDLGVFFIPLLDMIRCLVQRWDVIMCNERMMELIVTTLFGVLQLKSKEVWKVGVSLLAAISAVRHVNVSELFFTRETMNTVRVAVEDEDPEVRIDGLTILANFSAGSERDQMRLIEIGVVDMQLEQCGMNDSGLTAFAGMARNFLSSSHSVAIQFVESPMMLSLVSRADELCHQAREYLCCGLCCVYQAVNDYDLIVGALNCGDRCLAIVIDLLEGCERHMLVEITRSITSVILFCSKRVSFEHSSAIINAIRLRLPSTRLSDLLCSYDGADPVHYEITALMAVLALNDDDDY